MRRITQAAMILAVISVVGLGTFSFADGNDNPCEFSRLELQGETFSNLEEFRDYADEEGLDLEQENVFEEFEFEEREDGLYYRSLDCGVEQVNE